MRAKFISILVAGILMLSVFYYYISGLPQYTFYLIYKSIKNHDIESFYKYVDIDSISNNIMDDSWNEAMQHNQPKDEWGALGIGLAQAMKPMAKTALTDLAKQEITNAIEDIKQPATQETRVEETPVKYFMNRFKSLKDLASTKIRTSGKVSEVEIPNEKKEASLIIKMRQTPQRYWKIVAMRFPYQPREIKATMQEDVKRVEIKPTIKEDTKQEVSNNLSSSPEYIQYYIEVRNKISKVAYDGYNRRDAGEVYLVFTIRNNGEVSDIRVAKEKSTNSAYLRQIAIEAVKTAAPFRAFPADLNYPQLDFKVVLSYEIQ